MPPIASPAHRLRSLLSTPTTMQRLVRCLSSYSSPAAAWCPSNRPADVIESDPAAEYSQKYRLSLMYTKPNTIRRWSLRPHLRNSVSLIGTVDLPLKKVATRTGHFGVHTVLRVSGGSGSPRSLWMLVKFWHDLAETACEHLKKDDLIYVSGSLGSYEKVFEDGRSSICYEVIGRELNYVNQDVTAQKVVGWKSAEVPGEPWSEKNKRRLHLWQIFFANPLDWYDNRRQKENPKQPDFKHKHTREALWLNDYDPPWIQKQLQLHDSRMTLRKAEDSRY